MIPEIPEIQKNYLGETQELQESLSCSPLSQALHLFPLLSPIAPVITLTLQEFNRISDYYDSTHQQISSLERQRDEDIKSYKTLSVHDHLLGTIIAEQIDSLAQSTLDFSELDRFTLLALQTESGTSELIHSLRTAPSSSDFPTLHAILTNPSLALLPDSDFASIFYRIGIRNKLKRAPSGQA